MDVEKCIRLHNEILRHGWVNSGHDVSQFETVAKSWTTHFGDDEVGILPDLVPEVRQFLQQARIIYDEPGRSGRFSFFWWVNNLALPGNFFQYEVLLEMALDPVDDEVPMRCEYGEKRFLLLYELNQLADQSLGLLYDQESHLCILCPDFDDIDRVLWKRTKWYPLDVVLEYWLNTIRIGNVVALPKGHPKILFSFGHSEYPWHYMHFFKRMLDETLEAFDKLVEAIEARLPQGSSLNDDHPFECGLVDADVLQLHEFPARFAREFLEKARLPRFENVAPGLQVITTSTFSKQPFVPDTVEKPAKFGVPPILLFYSKLDYNQAQNPIETRGSGPFRYPYRSNTVFPAGLYLLETETSTLDNSCKFILPFSIGGKGYARKTNGALYGENTPRDSFEDLYGLGYHPFETTTTQNLASILKNWLGMVERGDWKVDENGVAGGMETYKEADTKEHWEKYVIKRDFV